MQISRVDTSRACSLSRILDTWSFSYARRCADYQENQEMWGPLVERNLSFAFRVRNLNGRRASSSRARRALQIVRQQVDSSVLGHPVFPGRLRRARLVRFSSGDSLKLSSSFFFLPSLSLPLSLLLLPLFPSLLLSDSAPCTIKSDSSASLDGVMYGLWQCNVAVHVEA